MFTEYREQLMNYESGQTYSQIFYVSPFKIKNITEARIKWMHKNSAFCILFCNNDIYVKSVLVSPLKKRGGNGYVI